MLIRFLQDLEYHKIVDRLVHEQVPPQVEYSLTEYGQSVIPLLQALFQWGETHIEKHSDLIFQ